MAKVAARRPGQALGPRGDSLRPIDLAVTGSGRWLQVRGAAARAVAVPPVLAVPQFRDRNAVPTGRASSTGAARPENSVRFEVHVGKEASEEGQQGEILVYGLVNLNV